MNSREMTKAAAKSAKSAGAAGGRAAYLKARRTADRAPLHARLAAMRARLEVARRRNAGAGSGTGKRAAFAGATGAVGAASAYFMDPQNGDRRRDVARKRIAATARKIAERMSRQETQRATAQSAVKNGSVDDAAARSTDVAGAISREIQLSGASPALD